MPRLELRDLLNSSDNKLIISQILVVIPYSSYIAYTLLQISPMPKIKPTEPSQLNPPDSSLSL